MNSFKIKTAKSQCSCKNKRAYGEYGTKIKKKLSMCNNPRISKEIPQKYHILNVCVDNKNFD